MKNYINKVFVHFKKWGWALLAILALLISFDIEFEWVLIACNHATIVNKIVLALSYSYIAAALFHLIVNVLPYLKRKKAIKPFIRTQLWSIKDNLRLCKELVLPLSCLDDKKYKREEYCKIFTSSNLYENSFINNGKTKLTILKELRTDIKDKLMVILAYREYIKDDLFEFVNTVLDSELIRNSINPYPDIDGNKRFDYAGNQQNVGECIYDLNEKINSINLNDI